MSSVFSARWKYFVLLSLLKITTSYGQVSFEVNGGSQKGGIDMILCHPMDSLSRWMLTSRHQAGVKYSGETSLHSLNGVGYSFSSGIGPVVNAVFSQPRFYAAAGIQYSFKKGNTYLYLYLTKEIRDNDFHDHFILFVWQPPLTKDIRLLWQTELIFNFYGTKNDYSIQRFKPGMSIGRHQIGLMAEMAEKRKDFCSDCQNFGLFVKRFF